MQILQLFHDGMSGQVLDCGVVTEPFEISKWRETGMRFGPSPLQYLLRMHDGSRSPRSGEWDIHPISSEWLSV